MASPSPPRSQRRGAATVGGGGGGSEPPPRPTEAEGRRLLSLLRSGKSVGDSDGGALLAYLSDYVVAAAPSPPAGGDADAGADAPDSSNDEAGGDFGAPAGRGGGIGGGASPHRTYRSVVVASLRAAQASTATAAASPTSAAPPPPLSAPLARRIASDALLPLAASPRDYVTEAVWECVSEVILPCAVEREGGEAEGDEKNGGGGGGVISTLGIEVLLPSYLSRLSRSSPTSEAGGPPSDPAAAERVCGVLDALCSVPSSGYRLRPHGAAAVASALGELEGIAPGLLASSPRRRDGDGGGDVDRLGCLVGSLLRSLSELASHGSRDLDSLPPLVYQLCLLPSRIRSDAAGRDGHRIRILAGISDSFDALLDRGKGGEERGGRRRAAAGDPEAVRWAASTALTHVANALRVDPELVRAALRLVSDGAVPASSGDGDGAKPRPVPPFRYLRLTPFRLSVLLTMASGVPRTRSRALDAVRDLVLEEESVRIHRRRGRWFNALAGTLVLRWRSAAESEASSGSGGGGSDGRRSPIGFTPGTRGAAPAVSPGGPSESDVNAEYRSRGGTDRIVLSRLLSVAEFASASSGGGGGAEGTALLQSLIALGFHLVDCVKRDTPTVGQRDVDVLALPPLGLGAGRSGSASRLADGAAARAGRALLRYMFAAAGGDEDGAALAPTPSPLCRSMLSAASDRFCGMAPNAGEHSLLLRDLALLPSPTANGARGGGEEAEEEGPSFLASDVLVAHHLPAVVDLLSHVPGGGMPPAAALSSVVPAISALLRVQAGGRGGGRRRRRDVDDNLDHCLLLAKKALFCADSDRRRVAARVLVALLGVCAEMEAAAASDPSSSSSGGSPAPRHSLGAGDGMVPDEIRGYLRRCLTQHQSEVRAEVYDSLVELLPAAEVGSAVPEGAPDSPVPGAAPGAGAVSPVAPSPPPPPSRRRGPVRPGRSKSAQAASRRADAALRESASAALLSQLDRYVAVREGAADRRGRRERAREHGSRLSQEAGSDDDKDDHDEEEDDDDDDHDEGDPPLRLGLCLARSPGGSYHSALSQRGGTSASPSSPWKRGGGGASGGKKKKGQPFSSAVLAEARERILEPISRLLASCTAAVASSAAASAPGGGDGGAPDELGRLLAGLRRRVGSSRLDRYLTECEADGEERTAKERATAVVSTCLLVAAAAETLLGVGGAGEGGGEDGEPAAGATEGLFHLRSDAVAKAVAALSVAPTKKKRRKPKKRGKGGGSQNGGDGGEDLDPGDDEDPPLEDDEIAASGGEISQSSLDKSRRMVEEALAEMVTAPSLEFLAGSLRAFGVSAEKKSDKHDDEEEEEPSTARARLVRNLPFRRFLLERSLRLLDGSSLVVMPGRRLDAPSLGRGDEEEGDDDLRVLRTHHIAASLQLGPLAFAEFCAHAHEQPHTSLARSVGGAAAAELPLARLGLRTFASCMRRMALDIAGHPLSPARRVATLIDFAIRRSADLFLRTKGRWDGLLGVGAGQDDDFEGGGEDKELQRVLLALVLPVSQSKAGDGDSGETKALRGGLLAELVGNGMDGEAAECVDLIACAASVARDPNLRQRLGACLLRCWGDGIDEGANWEGPLGLDHDGTKSSHESCAASAARGVEMAAVLGGLLDADAPVPLAEAMAEHDEVRKHRAVADLPLCCPEDWPENHRHKMKRHANCNVGHDMPSVLHKVALALLVRSGLGHNFEENFNANGGQPSRRSAVLCCVDTLVSSPASNGLTVSRYVGAAASVISAAVDMCLADAEFAVLKTVPYITRDALEVAQTFASGSLQAAAKVISTASACAVSVDDDGTFSSDLLKGCRRLYALLARLTQSHMARPRGLVSAANQWLLKELASRTTPRIMSLLLSVQEKSEAGEGRYMADRRLESQGKVSAQVVFEKERSDNELMKVCARLTSLGLERESAWLEGKVVACASRDFRIRQRLIKEAREREAPVKKKGGKAKKASGSKRKARGESVSKKKKKKAEKGDESDGASDDMDGDSSAHSSAADKSSMLEVEANSDDDGEGDDGETLEGESIDDDDLTDTDEE